MSSGMSPAPRIAALVERVLGESLPIAIRAWDGSTGGPPDGPVVVLRNRRAVRHLLWHPGELGLARAYVAGDLEVDGDLNEALTRVAGFAERHRLAGFQPSLEQRVDLVRTLGVLGGTGLPPAAPPEEVVLRGHRHSLGRDRAAVSHHYDVGNDFYRLVLGPSLVYSCAYWASDADGYDLADAQRDKIDLICRKLDLRPGQRLLDVGCGWGSLVLHAAREYGVSAVGVTLSGEQTALARQRISEAGLDGKVEIRLQDYRQIDDGPFDAISSVGMAEHVGTGEYLRYARTLYQLLRPGGRLLNHQIARLREQPRPRPRRFGGRPRRTFIDAYVFPDGQLAPVGTTVSLLEKAGFEVRDVEALREHYDRTLRCWVANLERHWDEAVRLTSEGRARTWRLYMTGSAVAFRTGRIGVNQVLAVRTDTTGASGMPPTRDWLCGPPASKDPGAA
jgi:cyclopropane-fatty-acyl-phospholipid synthase